MRTNINIDDQLIDQARLLTGIKTKKAVVGEALKLLIRTQHEKQASSLRNRMRATATRLEADYQPGSELIEFTNLLDGEDFNE